MRVKLRDKEFMAEAMAIVSLAWPAVAEQVMGTAAMIFGVVLRTAGDTRTPMRVGLLVNAVNVTLNFLLIYPARPFALGPLQVMVPGAGLGMIGAAAASTAAYTWGGIHITTVLWKHPLVSPKGVRLRPDMTVLKPCAKIAFPNILQQFGVSLGFVFFASMINSLGETATAAHTIANTVESAFYIPCYGLRIAAATLIGNACGARGWQTDEAAVPSDYSDGDPSDGFLQHATLFVCRTVNGYFFRKPGCGESGYVRSQDGGHFGALLWFYGHCGRDDAGGGRDEKALCL